MREADEAVRVSLLPGDRRDRRRVGADALHPGYGFLSENPALARACARGRDHVRRAVAGGDRADGRQGPGQGGGGAGGRAGRGVAERRGGARLSDAYPLLVKAAAGGGGRGMRVVESPDGLDEAIAAAQREAAAGFGDDRVFIERFLPRARHIEVQVIGDTHGTVLSLGERECSLQRRHQKVLEESPSPVVSPELRARLGEEAIALAKAAGYHGAGTVEFIADADDPSTHFFLEMNARLQVEHPVTELVTGLDLVELQLRVAAGEALDVDADHDRPRDRGPHQRRGRELLPVRRPGAGSPATRDGVRVDAAVETGSVVGTDYDSMIAKVIAHGPDRATALARLDRALADTAILGLTTNTGFLRTLLAHEGVRAGEMDTGLIGRLEPGDAAARATSRSPAPPPRSRWRCRSAATTRSSAATAGASAASARRRTGSSRVDGGEPLDIVLRPTTRGRLRRASSATAEGWLAHDGWTWHVTEATAEDVHHAHADGELRAPMPGAVLLTPTGDRRRGRGRPDRGRAGVDEDGARADRAGRRHGDRAAACPWATRSAATRSSRRWRPHDRLQDQHGRPRGAGAGSARAARARADGRRREGPRAPHRAAASCCRASASTACWTRARRSWSSRRWPRTACTTATRPARGSSPASAACQRPRVRDRGQRRHRQGRHLLPDDGQEAPARAGGRPPQPAAVHLPRGLRRRVPAAAGRRLPRPRALRPDLLQPGHDVAARHPADRVRDGLLHRRRRLRARR